MMNVFNIFKTLVPLQLLLFQVCLGGVYDSGPYTTAYVDYAQSTTGLDHKLGVYAPNAPGLFPVMYFSSGFADNIPADAYETLFSRVSSHGYVVIAPYHLGSLIQEYNDTTWFLDVMSWSETYLEDSLITQNGFNLGFAIDFINQYLSGHSAGSHVMCNFLKEQGCYGTKGLVLLSPVDGADPFGVVDNFCIDAGQKLNFETPTLLISGGLDSLHLQGPGENFPVCAPEAISNKWYFDALKGPVWMINATEYGHLDMCDMDDPIGTDNAFCPSNVLNTTDYHNAVAGEYVAFLDGITYGDCSNFNYLEDEILIPLEVEITIQSGAVSPCNNGYCDWLPPIMRKNTPDAR